MKNSLLAKCYVSSMSLLSHLNQVDAKYCLYTIFGHSKYFYCSPFERCCGTSCCENLSQFYRLWYFWFCIVLLLLFCSGGGYFYKWKYSGLRQRIIIGNPNTGTPMVTMTTTSISSTDGTCTRIPTGMTYHPAWGRVDMPPSYSSNVAPPAYTIHSSTVCVHHGPPPSYDSVYPQQTVVNHTVGIHTSQLQNHYATQLN